jgi:hypothetical protein
MGNYTDLWHGEMLYYQLFQIGIIFAALSFIWVDLLTAFLILGVYILAFQFFLVKRRANKKEKHEGERHLDSHTLREKDYREDKVYSFTRYEELEITNKLPIEIEKLPEYQEALTIEIERENDRMANLLPGAVNPEAKPKPKTKPENKTENKPKEGGDPNTEEKTK